MGLGRLVGCLTEKAVYDPPSSVAAAGAGDTFPRGEGKGLVFFVILKTHRYQYVFGV